MNVAYKLITEDEEERHRTREAPEGRLSIISVYGPLQPFFDQSWKVPDVERVE